MRVKALIDTLRMMPPDAEVYFIAVGENTSVRVDVVMASPKTVFLAHAPLPTASGAPPTRPFGGSDVA